MGKHRNAIANAVRDRSATIALTAGRCLGTRDPKTDRMSDIDETYRVVTRGENGEMRVKSYESKDRLMQLHTQIGVDDCSTNLALRGLPVFRGLIGPMSEEKGVVRYESPDVFEALTKEWTADQAHVKKSRRSRSRVRT